MADLPAAVETYISAYNRMDVAGMLGCLTDDVRFENYAGDALTAEADGKDAFRALAEMGVAAFKNREQAVRAAITVRDVTLVEIGYRALVAQDLPNGWVANQTVAFDGRSLFELRNGLIAKIVDEV
ncbi:MAG: nuclear transport factor 2 family protein [Pseudomonadota bacterium]